MPPVGTLSYKPTKSWSTSRATHTAASAPGGAPASLPRNRNVAARALAPSHRSLATLVEGSLPRAQHHPTEEDDGGLQCIRVVTTSPPPHEPSPSPSLLDAAPSSGASAPCSPSAACAAAAAAEEEQAGPSACTAAAVPCEDVATAVPAATVLESTAAAATGAAEATALSATATNATASNAEAEEAEGSGALVLQATSSSSSSSAADAAAASSSPAEASSSSAAPVPVPARRTAISADAAAFTPAALLAAAAAAAHAALPALPALSCAASSAAATAAPTESCSGSFGAGCVDSTAGSSSSAPHSVHSVPHSAAHSVHSMHMRDHNSVTIKANTNVKDAAGAVVKVLSRLPNVLVTALRMEAAHEALNRAVKSIAVARKYLTDEHPGSELTFLPVNRSNASGLTDPNLFAFLCFKTQLEKGLRLLEQDETDLNVSRGSNANAMANAIIRILKERGQAVMKAGGSEAIFIAMSAVINARGRLKRSHNMDAMVVPAWITEDTSSTLGRESKFLRFNILPCPINGPLNSVPVPVPMPAV